jgi:hypothetical protein
LADDLKSIIGEMTQALGAAADTEEGRKAIAGHTEDFQFDLDDGGAFYVSLENGVLRVRGGRMSRTGYYDTTYVETNAATLRQLMAGRLRPVEAIEQNRFRMVIRMYEGCQITILLRIAGEAARERFLAAS